MATYIQDTLDLIDGTVATYAQSVFTDFGGPVGATIRLGGVVALAFLGINLMMQWVPLRVTDFARWAVRYLIILAVATSWSQFLPFYDMLTNVPSSIGAALLEASSDTTLNAALDDMVTSIFDFSDRAADESGFFSISLLSIVLAIVGSLMACVAILVAGIAKIGLAMAVSLAPLFIASRLFRGTSDLFTSWAKFTLGFAMIPMVLAGVMGAIVGIEPVDTEPLSTELPVPPPKADGLSPEDQLRLDQMEDRLRALADQEGGMTREELQAMLDANAAELRAEVRRQLLADEPVTAGVDPTSAAAEARKRMEEERKRREAIEKAQVASNGLVIDGATNGQAAAGGTGRRLSENEGFLAAAAEQTHDTVRAEQIADPSRTIVQGTILEGVLETAINTDLPGAIRAVLTEDVVSYDGSTTLLPRGTRLIGTYSSTVKIAQRRALIAWNRAVTPAGTSVALGGIGADALGRSGQTGHVDTHFWTRFGSAALISLVGAAPSTVVNDRTNDVVADTADDIGDDLESASRSALDAYLRIAPTINVDQGDRLTILVNRDLLF